VGPQLASAFVLSAFLLFCPASGHVHAGPAIADQPSLTELWTEPSNLDRLDFTVGPWGTERSVNPRDQFVFVRSKRHGSSPGLKVRDGKNRTWHVKQGREAQPEVLVSRVLSAIGYRQPPVSYVGSFTLMTTSGPHVVRGGRFRLSDPSLRAAGHWAWANNPFVGSRPYEALLVVLVLLNSADLKDSNNTVYEIAQPVRNAARRWYVVRDLGTSLGETGRFDPTPNNVAAFERHRFVTGIKNGYVEFDDYHAVHRDLLRTITPADVRWATALLARLTDRQWRAAFGAAGYEPPVADRFVRSIAARIDQGRALGDRPARSVGPMLQ